MGVISDTFGRVYRLESMLGGRTPTLHDRTIDDGGAKVGSSMLGAYNRSRTTTELLNNKARFQL